MCLPQGGLCRACIISQNYMRLPTKAKLMSLVCLLLTYPQSRADVKFSTSARDFARVNSTFLSYHNNAVVRRRQHRPTIEWPSIDWKDLEKGTSFLQGSSVLFDYSNGR